MNEEIIIEKMSELEERIKYRFKDINRLATAMNSEKIKISAESKKHKEYTNEGLATVGDALIKLVLADYLYNKPGIKTKGNITENKKKLESNKVMRKITLKFLIDYAYNDKHFYSDKDVPEHERVVNKKHDPYVEAVAGAVFYDCGFDKAREWITEWLLPHLEKYRDESAAEDNKKKQK